MSAEFWVMRIVVAEVATGGVTATEQAMVDRGDLQLINGDLCEPIESYEDQHDAEARALKEHGRTGHPHKVVMNAEIGDL